MGDRDALKQVALIALDNALKHSEGHIAQRQAPWGIGGIRVQDCGEGIPPEQLEHILDRSTGGMRRLPSPERAWGWRSPARW